jgi:hypothetical protein
MVVKIGQEFFRNPASGSNKNKLTSRIPNAPSARVGVASDPGVAGGPSNVPAGAFGAEGGVEAGRAIQAGANSIIASETALAKSAEAARLRAIAQKEEVEMTLRVKEANDILGKFAGEVDRRDFSGEGLSPLDRYRKKSQDHIDKLIKKAQGEQFTPTFQQEYARRLLSSSAIHNASVATSIDDITKKEFIDVVEADYQVAATKNRNHVKGWLLNNAEIHKERSLILGQTKANELKKAADTEAVLSTYKRLFDLGDLKGAEEALDEPGVILIAGKREVSNAFNAINAAKVQKGINEGIALKHTAASSFITLSNGSLWDVRLNDGKGGVVKGSEDKTKGVLVTDFGAMQFVKGADGTAGKWEFIAKDPTKQTDQDKINDKIDSLKKFGVLLTPDLVLRLHGMEPKALSEFAQKAEILSKIDDLEVRRAALESLALGLTISETDRKREIIESLPITPTFTQEMKNKALLSLGTDKADLRSPEEKTEDIVKKGSDTGKSNVAQKQAELTGGLPELEGAGEAYKEITKAETLLEANFAEPMKVDSKVTNSIRAGAEKYVQLISRNGNVQLLDGGAQILGQMVKDAESFLINGTSKSIGHATWMAFNNLSDEQRGSMERVTGLAQVNQMLGITDDSPPVAGDEGTINKDVETVEASREKALRDIASLESQQIEGLNISDATGIWSALRAFAGATIGQIFPGAENKEVTKSRLMFSLIARDVVRMISLSPRFAVKEQELIQSIFAGPELFNSPRQALNRIITMKGVIDKKIEFIKGSLQRQPSFDRESELVEEASGLIEIRDRMNMFTFDLIPIQDVQTSKAVTDLGVDRSQKFYNSLSDSEKRGLPREVKEAIFIQKRDTDAGVKKKRRKAKAKKKNND